MNNRLSNVDILKEFTANLVKEIDRKNELSVSVKLSEEDRKLSLDRIRDDIFASAILELIEKINSSGADTFKIPKNCYEVVELDGVTVGMRLIPNGLKFIVAI
jgi:hypothetical protein